MLTVEASLFGAVCEHSFHHISFARLYTRYFSDGLGAGYFKLMSFYFNIMTFPLITSVFSFPC